MLFKITLPLLIFFSFSQYSFAMDDPTTKFDTEQKITTRLLEGFIFGEPKDTQELRSLIKTPLAYEDPDTRDHIRLIIGEMNAEIRFMLENYGQPVMHTVYHYGTVWNQTREIFMEVEERLENEKKVREENQAQGTTVARADEPLRILKDMRTQQVRKEPDRVKSLLRCFSRISDPAILDDLIAIVDRKAHHAFMEHYVPLKKSSVDIHKNLRRYEVASPPDAQQWKKFRTLLEARKNGKSIDDQIEAACSFVPEEVAAPADSKGDSKADSKQTQPVVQQNEALSVPPTQTTIVTVAAPMTSTALTQPVAVVVAPTVPVSKSANASAVVPAQFVPADTKSMQQSVANEPKFISTAVPKSTSKSTPKLVRSTDSSADRKSEQPSVKKATVRAKTQDSKKQVSLSSPSSRPNSASSSHSNPGKKVKSRKPTKQQSVANEPQLISTAVPKSTSKSTPKLRSTDSSAGRKSEQPSVKKSTVRANTQDPKKRISSSHPLSRPASARSSHSNPGNTVKSSKPTDGAHHGKEAFKAGTLKNRSQTASAHQLGKRVSSNNVASTPNSTPAGRPSGITYTVIGTNR